MSKFTNYSRTVLKLYQTNISMYFIHIFPVSYFTNYIAMNVLYVLVCSSNNLNLQTTMAHLTKPNRFTFSKIFSFEIYSPYIHCRISLTRLLSFIWRTSVNTTEKRAELWNRVGGHQTRCLWSKSVYY